MTHAIDPDQMTGAERLDEVAKILATVLLRLRPGRMKKRRISRDNCLEVSGEISPPAINP